MSTLCTFPGKFGDLLWALPAIRALSRRLQEPIDLMIADDMRAIVPLLKQQPYLDHVWANPQWIRVHVTGADRVPPTGLARYDQIYHLGYRDWPQRALPFETLDCLNAQRTHELILDAELQLDQPWITLPASLTTHARLSSARQSAWVCGFTDEHFELKYGIWSLLTEGKRKWKAPLLGGIDLSTLPVSICTGARWQGEAGHQGTNWLEGARWLHDAPCLLADNSGWHVLAVAMGRPVVMMEPSEARWNPIFFPRGTHGPQVTLVRGNDNHPTFDARHVADALEAVCRKSG